MSGCRCKLCFEERRNRTRRTTEDEARKIVESKGYKYIGIKFENKKCIVGYVCNVHTDIVQWSLYGNIKRGHGCNICGQNNCGLKNRICTLDEMKNIFDKNGLILLEDKYPKNIYKIKFLCKKHCNTIGYASFKDVKAGKICCKECIKENSLLEKYRSIKKSLEDSNFTVLTEFDDFINTQRIDFYCNKHPNDLLTRKYNRNIFNIECPFCSGKRKSFDEIKDNFLSNDIKILDEKYISATHKMKCLDLLYNKDFYISINKFYSGRTSPYRNNSASEREIIRILDELEVKYEYQKSFEDCVNAGRLFFDFFLNDYNTVIEYDGEQHYYPVNFNGIDNERAEYSYVRTVENDNIKNSYCIKNNINIIRIPYWNKDSIKNIMLDFIINH